MANNPLIGAPVSAIPTPAPIVDLDRLEGNLRRMASYFAARPCKLRPHFKSHKCVELARRQLAAGGCSGTTCAKLSEAEQLVAGGVTDILIANQVVGSDKARRLAVLNHKATVRSAVDSVHNARELSAAASNNNTTIPVLVEVDVGMKRCGVPPGEPALALAQEIMRLPGLRFDGLQGYEGHLVALPDRDERASKTREALAPLIETRRLIERAGIPVAIVSSGGTGTYDITGNIEGVNEVQCGSYALMDGAYARIRPEFVVARWILATVISARDGWAVVDVGTKGLGCEFGLPTIEGRPDAKARYTAEEHTPFDGLAAQVGDKLRIIPSHGCTTQNLYRQMWIARGDTIVDVWPIEGAGCLE
ncbi:MAG: DSD1 family PLP-dependent enzyme [Verrucomicrobiae bacterium]|nr:DSD1 family PLP-dependent enzyme [Verrucomicrobiae bacterium]